MMIFRGLKSANFVKIILISKVENYLLISEICGICGKFVCIKTTFLKMQEIYLKHFCGDSWHFFVLQAYLQKKFHDFWE